MIEGSGFYYKQLKHLAMFAPRNEKLAKLESFSEQRCFSNLLSALKRCSDARDLKQGKKLHDLAKSYGFQTHRYVAAALIKLYGKCREMALAKEVFDGLVYENRDVVVWTSLITGYVDNGEGLVALNMFRSMDCEANAFTFVAAVKACRVWATEKISEKQVCLGNGIAIHKRVQDLGFDTDVVVATALVDMYCKCGSMKRAKEMFDSMRNPNVVTWSSLMLGYVSNGESSKVIELFSRMNCKPNSVTFVAVLKACSSVASENKSKTRFCLEKGVEIHHLLMENGFDADAAVASALLDMYCKCGSMQRARNVFDEMIHRSVSSWNSLLLGYVANGESSEALRLFTGLNCEPNSVTFVAALKACGCLGVLNEKERQVYLDRGRELHEQVKSREFDSHIVVATSVVDMYSKCGCMKSAREVFDNMPQRNVVTWNSLISGYVENGESLAALEILSQMDCEKDSVTFIVLLKACGSLACQEESEIENCLQLGMDIHKEVEDRGLCSDVVVATALLDMYRRCRGMQRAQMVFDRMVERDVVAWTSIMFGYVENGECLKALNLFRKMDCGRDACTYIAALKACGGLAGENEDKQPCLQTGMIIHEEIKVSQLESETMVANSLIEMYSKCGHMKCARETFDRMPHRDLVSWTSLIQGYIDNQESGMALELFSSMDCKPDSYTYVAAIKACGVSASERLSEKELFLEKGIAIHKEAKLRGFAGDEFLSNSLIDMYSKCGSMELAKEVFDGLKCRNVVAWTSLILGYVANAKSLMAMESFYSMECEPNLVTYVAVLKACGTLAALPAGKDIHSRVCKLGLEQDQTVATTLLDFYGKCGSITGALQIFNNINSPDVVAWNTLISSYSSLGDSNQVFRLLNQMLETGVQLDGITFVCVLMACSHAGLVEKGRKFFKSIPKRGICLSLEHYNCMVDLLGRANKIPEALELVKCMALEPSSVTWTSLLGACRKWKNVEAGRVAFDALLALDARESAGFVLMSDIYNSSIEKNTRLNRTGRAWWCDSQGRTIEFTCTEIIIIK